MGFLLQFMHMLFSGHSEQPLTPLYGRIKGLVPYQVVMLVVVGLPAVFQELLADGQALADIEAARFVGGERRILFY